ncbi:hypothetical protein L596_016375 [Steinernema carpocapsae]|uniref:Acyl-CoA thioesterase 2 C-terminal domain-containing protein n=1 Tax=Steinernema carpocapsae TaxID=34508 RepID=A0A4U5NHS7_STECR|nr:hypothetical protein L596_016375 [Steinernema carpocapsae]
MPRFPLLSEVFKPVKVKPNVVRFDAPHVGITKMAKRVFGGQLLGYAQISVEFLFPEFCVLSIRGNYVASGNTTLSLMVHVDRIAETQFVNVTLTQNDVVITTAHVKIGTPDDIIASVSHPLPLSSSPSQCEDLIEVMKTLKGKSMPLFLKNTAKWGLFEMRPLSLNSLLPPKKLQPFTAWTTVTQTQRKLPYPPNSGRTVLTMMSDFWSMPAPMLNSEVLDKDNPNFPASINHSVFFHTAEDLDPTGWYLFHTECHVNASCRFLMTGNVFDQRGKCVISFEQEGFKATAKAKI